ncbi:MAG: Ig-like domain-containing protein [Desulfobacterales bacterium]|nr:Ig-like domain-containing protein [Desulfobacterales bacterium]
MKYKKLLLLYKVSLALFLACAFIGCGAEGQLNEGTPPEPVVVVVSPISQVSLESGSAAIVANGVSQSLLSATVKCTDGNNASDGTQVVFVTTAGDLDASLDGVQTSYTSKTKDGVATAYLTSPTLVGTANVTATVSGINSITSVAFVPGSIKSIILSASPNNLTADGTSKAVIRAEVKDEYGNAVADGENIAFEIVSGKGQLSLPAQLTAIGIASVEYTVSAISGKDIIKAKSVNGITSTVEVMLIQALIGKVRVEASSVSVIADGKSKVQVNAYVNDEFDKPVGDGTPVTFTTTAGDLDEDMEGIQLIKTAYTSKGIATVFLVSTVHVGVASVQATAGGVTDVVDEPINFIPGGASTVVLSPSSKQVTLGGANVTINALVTDSLGNPCTNETLTFKIIEGSGTLSSSTVLCTDGKATINFTPPNVESITKITATTTNGTAGTCEIKVTNVGREVASIKLSVAQSKIKADEKSSTTITVTMLDSSGKAVPKGTSASVTTSLGKFSNGSTIIAVATPDESGKVDVSLHAGKDPGVAQITVSSNGITNVASVVFECTRPVAASLTLTVSSAKIKSDGVSSTVITATIMDSAGVPVVAGTPINFSTTLGTFRNGYDSVYIGTPDDTGKITVSLIAGKIPGIAKITAVVDSITNMVSVEFEGGALTPDVIELKPADYILPADGLSTMEIIATAKTSNNQAVQGVQVSFKSSHGSIIAKNNGVTDANGQVIAVITSERLLVPKVEITAECQGAIGKVYIAFTGIELNLTANPSSLYSGGTSNITGVLKDAAGKVISNANVSLEVRKEDITDNKGRVIFNLINPLKDFKFKVESSDGTPITNGYLIYYKSINPDVIGESVPLDANGGAIFTDNVIGSVTLELAEDTAGTKPISNKILSYGSTTSTVTTDSLGQFTYSVSSNSGKLSVRASGNGATAKIFVYFTKYKLSLTANPEIIKVNTGSATITATLLEDGVAKSNESISFSTTLGTITESAVTDNNGSATATLKSGFQSGIAVVNAMVTVDGMTLTASVQVSFVGELAHKIVLSVNPSIVATKGVAEVKANVYDSTDQPVANQKVFFKIEKGAPGGGEYLENSAVTTDNFGVAIVKFIAGTLPTTLIERLTVVASVSSDFKDKFFVQITIAGPPANIGVGTNLEKVTADGAHLVMDVSAVVTDINGNPVVDGTPVYFSVSSIAFDEYRTIVADDVNRPAIKSWTVNASNQIIDEERNGAVGITSSTQPCEPDPLNPAICLNATTETENSCKQNDSFAILNPGEWRDKDNNLINVEVRVCGGIGGCWNRYYGSARGNVKPSNLGYTKGNPFFRKSKNDLGITWFTTDVNLDGVYPVTYGSDCMVIGMIQFTESEDKNKNGILDAGEDINGNGVLDPVNGAVIANKIETGNGIAKTQMSYLQTLGQNIKVRITAEAGGVKSFYDATLLCTKAMCEAGTCGQEY